MARVIKATARVIPKGLAEAKAEAAATLEAARAEAEVIVRAARASAEALRDEARSEGLASAQREAASTMLGAARTKDALLAGAEQDVVEIALAAAGKIVEAHVAVGPEEVLALVKSTLDRARRARSLVLTLHPDDAASLATLEALPSNVHIEVDASLVRGDCVVKSELGTLDARVATKLASVRAALFGSR